MSFASFTGDGDVALGASSSLSTPSTTSRQIASNTHHRLPKGSKRKKLSKTSKTLGRWTHNLALEIVHSKWFDRFILFVIILNTLTMAAEDPTAEHPDDLAAVLERAYLIIFILEMLIKMFALGFGKQDGYFHSRWNWLDFVVVASAILEEFYVLYHRLTASTHAGEHENSLVVLRVVRVLRPLKSVSSLPKLASMIEALQNAFIPMGKAIMLMVAFILLMAVFATNFYMGSLRFFPDDTHTDDSSHLACFDDIFTSMFTLFSVVTLEGWSENILYPLQHEGKFGVAIFLAVTILVGGFWLLNLAITVLTNEYEKAKQASDAEAAERLIGDTLGKEDDHTERERAPTSS